FQAGQTDEAKVRLALGHAHVERLLELFDEFGRLGRRLADRTLATARRSTERLAGPLGGGSIAAAATSVLVGSLWARRVIRPIYELSLRVESVAQKRRIQVDPRREDLDALAQHVSALLEKLEDQDALLALHRRRLIQSEKLSAVGELAAK